MHPQIASRPKVHIIFIPNLAIGLLNQVDDNGCDEATDIANKIETLEDRFDSLRTQIISELSARREITVQKLLDTLTSLPLSLKKEYESSINKHIPIFSYYMRAETQINELFIRLNPLLSFIDYSLIEFFIKKYGSDALKKDMRSYCSEMKIFMKETTIKQLINYFPGQPEIPPKFSLIEAKIGRDASKCTLEHLNNIRKRYCCEVKLSEIVFHLVAVLDSNSFIVRWIIPSALVSDIMKSTGNIKQNLYQECKITSFTLDAMWLHISEPEIGTMFSQVHLGDTKIKDLFHTMYKQIVCELKIGKISEDELSSYLMERQPKLQRDAGLHLCKAFLEYKFPLSLVDFGVLTIIIERFGSDCLKSVMTSYCNCVSISHTKQSTAQQLIGLSPVQSKLSKYIIIAECRIMEEPSDYRLEKLFSFQTKFCNIINLSEVCFVMGQINTKMSGSFTVRWLVPSCLALDLLISANQIKGNELFQEVNIASLHLGNGWLYNCQLTPFGARLKEQYQQSQGSPSPVEWIPSPTKKIFRLAMIQRERVQRDHIEDRFVQMTVSGRVDDILCVKSPVEIEHIFRNTLRGSEIILIEGAPGSGKSTLTVHICQRWGKGELFQQFTVVILVQLRDPAVQSAQTITDLLPIENVAVAQELATELIATNGRGVLWVLDGWDELPTHLQRDSIFCKLLPPKPSEEKLKEIEEDPLYAEYVARGYSKEELWVLYLQNNPQLNRSLNECSVIVTARPISSGDLHPVVSSRIEVLGFTPEEQRQYFTECLKGDTKALEGLLEKIQENPVIQSICYLPLNAAFVVHSFKLKGQLLADTVYEIYSTVILSCIQRHFERDGRGHVFSGELASLDDLSRSEAVREPFQCLCELAYYGVMKNKVTFSSSDLPQGSNTLSLLQAIESFLQSGKSVFYNFLHLSIQEVLSAHYIATWLSDSEQVSQFQQLFNQPRFAAVFQFFSAITKLKSPGIRQVIDRIVEAKSKSLSISLLHCLYETQDPSLCLYVAERLKYNLDLESTSLSPLDCLSISFFLSSVTGKEISVNLWECSIGDFGAKCLTKYLGSDVDHVSKVAIDLSNNDIHEEGASYNARIHLYSSDNPIGDTGASLISEAVRDTIMLKTLIIRRCGITSRGAEDLSRALAKNSSLEKLDINDNKLGDEGISHVAEALKQNTQLKELWIGDCGMTDKGAASLASALSVNNSLKMLHMGGWDKGALTEDGLSTIAQSLANKAEFVKLTISFEFGSALALQLKQEVNETRTKTGLPPIEVEGGY